MRKWLIVTAVVFVIGTIVSIVFTFGAGPYIKARAISTLQDRYDAKVEFKNFHVWIFPYIRISGEDLVLRLQGRTDIPPLIRIHKFSASAELLALLRREKHIGAVHLEGLQITVPPKGQRGEVKFVSSPAVKPYGRVVIDEIISKDAELELRPTDPAKHARVFVIRRLILHKAGLGQPMAFDASLTNPQPVGQIITHGEFGPWQREDPGQTPVSGAYTFSHADLGPFKGIAGILSSQGKYQGILERIVVDGTTDTPDFRLDMSGNRIPLETRFHSIVDGTNGNTLLQPVDARLGQSTFSTHGGVTQKPGDRHRTVFLDVVSDRDRLEDLLRLAIKGDKPPLRGWITFKSKLVIPPGGGDLGDRLQLDGRFGISEAHFTNQQVQDKLASLSRHGRGKPNEKQSFDVLSNLTGRFRLRNALMTLSDLNFSVPGAIVHLNGTYALRSGALNFKGSLSLNATVSQMTTGIKSVLLRPVDPLFRRGKMGTVLPITVTGTEEHPAFGVQIKQALTQNLP